MLESVKEAPVDKESEKKTKKNIFFKDIEVNTIKEALLSEIDMSKLKELLVADIKETLLKEIDVSNIKEALTKDIAFKKSSEDSAKNVNKSGINDKEAKQVSERVNLPAYKYGFTETLIEEHKELLSIHENIMQSAKDNEFATIPMMLSKFSKICLSHFNEEEELFTYMKVLGASRSEIEKRVATEFAAEMKNLSVSIFTTLNQSNFIPVTDNSVNGFIREFEELGSILQERIGREEKILYPMYENSRKVVDIC